jgi:LysR family pca operon transcriptional activator
LCSHARLIKEELEFAETRIQNAGKGRGRVMTVGTLPSLAASVVPLAVSRWRERHPRIVLRVVEKVEAISISSSLKPSSTIFWMG